MWLARLLRSHCWQKGLKLDSFGVFGCFSNQIQLTGFAVTERYFLQNGGQLRYQNLVFFLVFAVLSSCLLFFPASTPQKSWNQGENACCYCYCSFHARGSVQLHFKGKCKQPNKKSDLSLMSASLRLADWPLGPTNPPFSEVTTDHHRIWTHLLGTEAMLVHQISAYFNLPSAAQTCHEYGF